jgi:hypothetical protein
MIAKTHLLHVKNIAHMQLETIFFCFKWRLGHSRDQFIGLLALAIRL